MRVIAACPHRVLDFVAVLAFALAPKAVGLVGAASTLAYALAGIHLLLTLVTRVPGGGARPVPLRVHGAIELVVGWAWSSYHRLSAGQEPHVRSAWRPA